MWGTILLALIGWAIMTAENFHPRGHGRIYSTLAIIGGAYVFAFCAFAAVFVINAALRFDLPYFALLIFAPFLLYGIVAMIYDVWKPR